MIDREKVIKGLEICSDCGFCETIRKYDLRCPYRDDDGKSCDRSQLLMDALALLKDRVKDYEAWAKEIGADTCVNCRHASWNRNDGTSTCPIEHNFALVKDGYCHLFIRM